MLCMPLYIQTPFAVVQYNSRFDVHTMQTSISISNWARLFQELGLFASNFSRSMPRPDVTWGKENQYQLACQITVYKMYRLPSRDEVIMKSSLNPSQQMGSSPITSDWADITLVSGSQPRKYRERGRKRRRRRGSRGKANHYRRQQCSSRFRLNRVTCLSRVPSIFMCSF